jgi:hypothetical protein
MSDTDRALKISELDPATNPASNSLLVIVTNPYTANADTLRITLTNFFANVTSNVVINGEKLVIPTTTPPANTDGAGQRGELRFNNTHIYVCIANNSWKRAALSTW